jgi:hypothetical protein
MAYDHSNVSANVLTNEVVLYAAISESILAGYLRMRGVRQAVYVKRRIHDSDGPSTAVITAEVLRASSADSVVVVLMYVHNLEVCVCTLTGMRWPGMDGRPSIVLKIVSDNDIRRAAATTASKATTTGRDERVGETAERIRTKENLRSAKVFLAGWLVMGFIPVLAWLCACVLYLGAKLVGVLQ